MKSSTQPWELVRPVAVTVAPCSQLTMASFTGPSLALTSTRTVWGAPGIESGAVTVSRPGVCVHMGIAGSI